MAATIMRTTIFIFAGLLMLSAFAFVSADKPKVVDKSRMDFWIWCLTQKSLYFDSPEEPPKPWLEEMRLQICSDSLRLMEHAVYHQKELPPSYAEALKVVYNNNQTLIDMHTCSLTVKHCPEETAKLLYQNVDFHMRALWPETLAEREANCHCSDLN